ncbi:hypothetical protein LCGC14_2182740 [marine sediment metagenome]|uniref:Uncharacterized protein n=1 Tax=marine sediment metagenome TaxID=412755 RepID=A0A0F9DLS9_9ZZZZ|nr:hypothetical protein [Nitrosopumilus sp.]
MKKQFEDSVAGKSDIKEIVSNEVRPLLEKLEEIVERLEKYHNHDVEFQRKLLLLLSRMLSKQEISMEAFDQLDSFLQKEYFWDKNQK